jgi:hypothetical protein
VVIISPAATKTALTGVVECEIHEHRCLNGEIAGKRRWLFAIFVALGGAMA